MSVPEPDYRFSLANERTFLAWIRTALALLAGGAAAAKALPFHHDALRWVVAAPPLAGGIVMAVDAPRRWGAYEHAMRSRSRLPVGRGHVLAGFALAAYGLLVVVAAIVDG